MEFKEDPKFSFIVPVYDVPKDVFKRCLMSLADQDYGNLEVIIVANGGDREAESMANEFSKGRESWRVLFTEEKGACNARNLGFKESTGEIVSFFNSDYIAKIGMVRMWVDSLILNPDCGFVYGAYEYNTKDRDTYWSKEFDVFQLRVANFIDCGFPLWRKHVVEWDSEVKSLQDWDFWLSVVEKDVKGHYLGREISFIAEIPRPKGLSHDSTDHWLERVKFIKDKHHIPMSDICVTSIGAQNHGVKIAQMLGADYRDDTLHKPHDYKALYLIGWYMHPNEASNGHSKIIAAFPKAKRIVHFVGADIYWLRKFSTEKIRQFAGALKLSCHHILSENEAAQAELRSYGIESEIVPIPPYTDLVFKPFPKDFSMALYLTNKSNFDKYLQGHTLSIVKAMPDVKFVGYGDADMSDFKYKNFEHKGNMTTEEWGEFVISQSAYLRLCRHDTRPLASDEFIIAGRNVITNIPAQYMDVIDTSGNFPVDSWDKFQPGFSAWRWPETKKKIVQMIRKIKKKQMDPSGEFLGERMAASLEYRQLLNKDKFRKKILSLTLPEKISLEVANA